MKYCPINYSEINETEFYSASGLKLLSPQLHHLLPLNYSAEEQRQEAINRTGKMSLQGVQLKLSARLKIKQSHFELVDQHGHYILKPQSEYYPELPENEAISMTLAKTIGIEIPIHGLVYSRDGSMTYFVKRFDRKGHKEKIPLEDFAQLSGSSRERKYSSSMEKIAKIVATYCTFPKIEAAKLFKITLFNFLIGNEDMHLKNFSLITRNKKITLSPAYDLLNTTIAQGNTVEEIALPLNGKKSNLSKKDLLEYYPIEHLGLPEKIINLTLDNIFENITNWKQLISRSFLSQRMREKYEQIVEERLSRLK